jgi:hypothetical protein
VGLTTILSLFNLIDASFEEEFYLKISDQTTFFYCFLAFYRWLLSVGRKS